MHHKAVMHGMDTSMLGITGLVNRGTLGLIFLNSHWVPMLNAPIILVVSDIQTFSIR
jgi:hypothetical protein